MMAQYTAIPSRVCRPRGYLDKLADLGVCAIVTLPLDERRYKPYSMEGTMRDLTVTEVEAVSGGEILVSPGQLGIALTDNTLVVVTGIAEAASLLQVGGAIVTAGSIGYGIGSALVEYTNIENVIGGWMYSISQWCN
jgi:hypothetical protein